METNNNIANVQQHIKSRYKLIKKIGEGGTSVVYLAEDIARKKDQQQFVAIKVLKIQWNQQDFEKWKYRIMNEAKVLRKLKSSHIVKIYDYQFNGDYPYIVIEYCDGKTIRQRLDKIGPRGELEALTVVERILKTLSEIHNSSLVHRDLKPSNVIINGYGDVKILDFGIVYEHDSNFELTSENSIVGSIQYLAPELISDSHKINFLCDFYSVGLILYELLTAKPAFQGTNQAKIIEQITKIGCPDINSVLSDSVHQLTRNIISRATSINPNDRFQSLSIFLRHINYAKYQIVEIIKRHEKPKNLLVKPNDKQNKNIQLLNSVHNDNVNVRNDYGDIDAPLGTVFTSAMEIANFLKIIVKKLISFLLIQRNNKKQKRKSLEK